MCIVSLFKELRRLSVADPGFPWGGTSTHYFVKYLPKTAWKWKKLHWEGAYVPSASSLLDLPMEVLILMIWRDPHCYFNEQRQRTWNLRFAKWQIILRMAKICRWKSFKFKNHFNSTKSPILFWTENLTIGTV